MTDRQNTTIPPLSGFAVDLLYQLRNPPELRHGRPVLGSESIVLLAFVLVMLRLLPVRRYLVLQAIATRLSFRY
jgi:hypothetical protein